MEDTRRKAEALRTELAVAEAELEALRARAEGQGEELEPAEAVELREAEERVGELREDVERLDTLAEAEDASRSTLPRGIGDVPAGHGSIDRM